MGDSKPTAVLTALKYVRVWRSTAWWQHTKTRHLTADPNNRTIWKQKWRWHNRGCVWTKIASEWAGNDEWSIKRKRCPHRPKIGEGIKPNKERKEPRKLDPPDSSIAIRTEGTTVQTCGESNVAEKWINRHYAMGQTLHGKLGRMQKTLHSWWKRRIAYPVTQIDDCVKHQEADHLVILGTEGQRKVTIDKSKEIRGLESGTWVFGIAAKKTMAGAVVVGKIGVPLKACTAMAAEIAGVSMLTAVLDDRTRTGKKRPTARC